AALAPGGVRGWSLSCSGATLMIRPDQGIHHSRNSQGLPPSLSPTSFYQDLGRRAKGGDDEASSPLSRSGAMSVPWVVEELQTVDLGDERLDQRFETLLSALGSRPNLSIPAACGGNAELKAAYRFFDNPKVTFDGVLSPHVDQTLRRI